MLALLAMSQQPTPDTAIAHLLQFAAIPSLVCVGLGLEVLLDGLDVVEVGPLVVEEVSLLVATQYAYSSQIRVAQYCPVAPRIGLSSNNLACVIFPSFAIFQHEAAVELATTYLTQFEAMPS